MASWQAFKHAQVGQEWAKGSAVTAGNRQYLPVLFPQVTENYGLPIRAFQTPSQGGDTGSNPVGTTRGNACP